jgi:hypothetical protein
MKKNFMLANGWGIIHDETGEHWVYIPLWDPVKFNKIGRALFATLVIKQHLRAIANKEAKQLLSAVLKEQAGIVAGGFVKSMEEGDGWCGTPYPHHFPGGGGVIGGDPDNPVYRKALGTVLNARINAKAAISLLGTVLKNKEISKVAELI